MHRLVIVQEEDITEGRLDQLIFTMIVLKFINFRETHGIRIET